MHVDVVTIFPQLFDAFRLTGVLGRAVERAMVSIDVHDLRDWAGNRWRQVDDEPYGGGAGMVMQVPPVVAAVRDLSSRTTGRTRTVLMTPRGRKFDQRIADEIAAEPNLIVLCGRYEGFDERILDILHPDEVSIGDFILGGGEVAAMAVIESVTRLIPGVVGDPESVAEDSFSNGLLDYPCYTRPLEFEGREVPEVLRSGNHEAVRRWRLERSVEATVTRRPDLVNLNWKKYPEEVRLMVEHFTSGAAKDQE